MTESPINSGDDFLISSLLFAVCLSSCLSFLTTFFFVVLNSVFFSFFSASCCLPSASNCPLSTTIDGTNNRITNTVLANCPFFLGKNAKALNPFLRIGVSIKRYEISAINAVNKISII
ncbi:Uncharacterised protein [Staphylococcus aureus]|nr:Uncharacterised protein [Staphylococcus aureus]